MILKSIKQKAKDFVFSSYGNMDTDSPGRIIFRRFPMPDETFPLVEKKPVLESEFMRNFDGGARSKKALVDHVIGAMIENIAAERTDYKRFFAECVERIDDLSFDGTEIKTVGDFFEHLPGEAAWHIAAEAYEYARRDDKFLAEDKKK